MNSYLKQQLYIFIISIINLVRLIVLFLLFKQNLVNCIIFIVWGFSIMPSLFLTYELIKKLTYNNGLQMGLLLGAAFGVAAFIIPILFAPLLMLINYYKVIKILIVKFKAKKNGK